MPSSVSRKETLVRKVLKGTADLGAAQIIRTTLRAVYIIVLARFLGPELYGLFNYGLGWYLAFMSLTLLGFDLILGKEGGQEGVDADTFVAATFRVQLAVTFPTALVCWLVALALEDPDISMILGVFSIALMGRSIAAWASFVFISREKSNRVFWLESTCRILEALCGTLALLVGGSLFEVVVIHALFWWVQAIWGLCELSAHRLLLIPNRVGDIIRSLGGAPIVLGLAGVFQVWIVQGPIILFRQLGGSDALLGQIALAFQVFGLLAGLSWVILRAVLPHLSKSVRAGRSADLTFANLLGQLTIVGAGAATVITYFFGDTVLHWLVGNEYDAAGQFLPYTVAATAAFTIGVGAHQILAAHGKYTAILFGTATGAVIMTGVMLVVWPLSPHLTPFLSLGAGLIAWMIVVGWAVYRVTPFPLMKVVWIPLTVSVLGITIGHTVLPLGMVSAVVSTATIFLAWAWYMKPLKRSS